MPSGRPRRAAAQRLHDDHRPLRSLRRVARHPCRKRDQGRRRSRFPRCAVAHAQRARARVRVGRDRRKGVLLARSCGDRPRPAASLWAAERHGLPGPDRYLPSRHPARCLRLRGRAQPAVSDSHRAKRRRVPRDPPTARQHAGRVSGRGRRVGGVHDSRPCHLSGPSPVAALDVAPGSVAHRRGRRHRRPLPHRVRAARDHAAHLRRLQAGGGSISGSGPTPTRTTCSRRCVRSDTVPA